MVGHYFFLLNRLLLTGYKQNYIQTLSTLIKYSKFRKLTIKLKCRSTDLKVKFWVN